MRRLQFMALRFTLHYTVARQYCGRLRAARIALAFTL